MKQRGPLGNQRTNPFYLLSAACMLVGCLAQSRALGLNVHDWTPLATLIGVLQVYEALVVGLAVYLIKRVGAVRDATLLLVLEAAFLVDATYLNAEMAASHPEVAFVVASLLFVLAGAKILVIRHLLGLRSPRTLVTVVLQLGLLLYMPVAFSVSLSRRIDAVGLQPGSDALPITALVFWWLLGGAMALARWAAADSSGREGAHPVVVGALAKAPVVSTFVHLLLLHWTYQLPLHLSYLAPVALGLGMMFYPVFASRTSRELAWLSPVAAVVLTFDPPRALVLEGDLLTVTPFRLALVGAALVFWFQREVLGEEAFGWAAVAALVLGVSGSSPSAIVSHWWRVVPQSSKELGFTAIVAAFVLLGLGFAFSLRRPRNGGPPRRSYGTARREPSHDFLS